MVVAADGFVRVIDSRAVCQLLTKVLLPALALSFFSKYSQEVIRDYGICFAVAAVHVILGIIVGHLAAFVAGVKRPYAQVMALTCGVPHPAIPLVMLPATVVNWSVALNDSNASSKLLATIGIYLTVILLLFATVVQADIATMSTKKAKGASSSAPLWKKVLRSLASVDHTLYCCLAALLIGVIPPVKEAFMPGGALSWLAGTINATGALSPALSVFIIGGLVWNTRTAALKRQQNGGAASSEPPGFLARLTTRAANVFSNKKATPGILGADANRKQVHLGKSETAAEENSLFGNLSSLFGSAPPEEPEPPVAVAVARPAKVSTDDPLTADLRVSFGLFDADGGGSIDVNELGAVMKSLKIEVTDEETKAMVAEVDADRSGNIDFDEFCELMRKERKDANGESKPSFATAVQNVQKELKGIGGPGLSLAERAELLRAKWERERIATSLWAAGGGDEKNELNTALPTDDGKPEVEPPSMKKFIVICCLFKLVVNPGLCIAINYALFKAGAIPNNPFMRLILDVYPCIPTAAALVAAFSAKGYDDAARFCAACMLPMYLLSIPTISGYIVVSVMLIG